MWGVYPIGTIHLWMGGVYRVHTVCEYYYIDNRVGEDIMANIERIRALLVGKTILDVREMDADPGEDELYPEGYTGLQLTVSGQLGEDTVQILLDREESELLVTSVSDTMLTWDSE